MFKTLFSFSLAFICACTNRTNRNEQGENASIQWQYLALRINDTIAKLTHTIDTLEVVTVNGEAQNYQINKAEKDSLFAQANQLTDFKGRPKLFCTDYVGKLKVQIIYNEQLSKEISFSSICNWRELSINTKRIDQLLNQILRSR